MSIEEDFEAFWQAYPKRTGRVAAFRQYQCAVYYQKAAHDSIMKGVEAYRKHVLITNTDFQYVKPPQKWLDEGCWDDEYELNLPRIEYSSPEKVRDEARISGFHKNGYWQDAWGERPGLRAAG